MFSFLHRHQFPISGSVEFHTLQFSVHFAVSLGLLLVLVVIVITISHLLNGRADVFNNIFLLWIIWLILQKHTPCSSKLTFTVDDNHDLVDSV